MALGWNEIKERAVKFSKEWAGTFNEEADAKPFLVEFFNVFGINNRRVASFEHRIKKLGDLDGYIDLLWKGTILIEMKSRGKNLDKAFQQAKEYLHGLKQHELPKYILVSDFENFRLFNMENGIENSFLLKELVNNVKLFGFIAGYTQQTFKAEDPVNIEAAYLMGKLHDALKDAGYTGHELEKYLVRLLFCLFAEDTTIFDKRLFQEYIENKTNDDGTDLGLHLAQLFQVLNTPPEKRQKTLDESLTMFPYVNGELFAEQLSFASFNKKMRQSLLNCCTLDWSKISPAIFGSMFQSVMDEKQRRNLGAHYTSEKNILKLIKPLFLDNLWQEFESIKTNTNKLKYFQRKIASLRFFDPACGCGNFLVITYRELRLLELEILKVLQKGQRVFDLESLMQCNIDRFYGIEYEEFPAQIAQVALWLIDHQMNMLISQEFGEYVVRLPLLKSAKIVQGNALRIDWESLLNPEKTVTIYAEQLNYIESHSAANEPSLHFKTANVIAEKADKVEQFPKEPSYNNVKFDYIFGNPPFAGKHLQSKEQKDDLNMLMSEIKSASDLDYVSAWFYKAAKFIKSTQIQVAFVSTNSITQGEQVSLLWNSLINFHGIKINFAHRTFKWNNEAKGVAAVHCVIIGFATFNWNIKHLFEYESVSSEPHELIVQQINPYLNSGPVVIINKRTESICGAPPIKYGNKPTDDGNYIFNDSEKELFLINEPKSEHLFRRFLGSAEFINNISRWCLWLKDIDPKELKNLPHVLERVEKVKLFRESSSAEPTRKSASLPTLFFYTSHPESNYLVIPETSSERRRFIPIGYMTADVISSNAVYLIPSASLFTFGIMCSTMHMAWTRTVCGRLKSDYRYSGSIVYNNFPWPENPTEKQKETIENAAQKVLDIRAEFPDSSLGDLYDPLTMPPALVKAHNELDKAVDLAYRPQPFINETKRIEFLFELYDKYTAGLFAKDKKKKG
ncbi:MAG TPA: SAM-dependent methyltransferase [Prolixibacteraceae bacterium]|nr:SAM-dependent methyltransferase [Prolixibacteraceae bacterium]